MMKKTIAKGLIMIAALGTASIAFAETDVNASANVSASTTHPGFFQQIKEVRADAKAEIQGIKQNLASSTKVIRDGMKDNVKNVIKARTENRYTKMLARFQATIDREVSIMARINTRIAKVKADGKDTTEAEKLTADAKIQLDAASAALITLKSEADTQAGMENSSTTAKELRDGLATMRKTGAEIELKLRTAHSDLIKAVVNLIRLSNGSLLKATTSAEVN